MADFTIPDDPLTDPFSSTGPYAGPPETWEGLAARDDGRAVAGRFGEHHNQVVNSLLKLRDDNGGGYRGLMLGALDRLHSAEMITSEDRMRLLSLFDAVLGTGAGDENQARTAAEDMVRLHGEINSDPEASVIALAIASTALSSYQLWGAATVSSDYAAGLVNGAAAAASVVAADVAGAAIGSVFGASGALAAEASASLLVATASRA
jgi:hypothetical protein